MILSFRKIALLVFPTLLLLSSCDLKQRSLITAQLDDVESYINESPDSALAVLQGSDSAALASRSIQARYSLLRTMAMDKCYMDITDPNILEPATAWYAHHGSADERMKMLYYQGRVEQDKGNQAPAAVFFSHAEKYAQEATDSHAKGLLYLAFSNVYNTVYNTTKEEEYIKKGLAVLQDAEDSLYYSALGLLALVHHSKKEWSMADSLYQTGIMNTRNNPSALKVFLSNYARMKMIQPNRDPEGAIALLDQKREQCGSGLSLEEAAVYAYALMLTGKSQQADMLLKQIDNTASTSPAILIWRSRIEEARGNWEEAFRFTSKAHIAEWSEIDSIISESVVDAIREDTAATLRESEHRLKVRTLSFLLLIAIAALFVIGIMYQKKKRESEIERLLFVCDTMISEHQHALAMLSNDLQERNSEKIEQEARISEQATMIEDLSDKLQTAKDEYMKERLARLQQVGWLKNVLWDNEETRLSDKNALARLRKELSYVHDLDGNDVLLVRRLDKELDGMISQLRKDLKLRGKPKEVLFMCGCILSLDPGLLAEVLGTSVSNVYLKKHRFKKQLEVLSSTNERYKPLLGAL